MTQNCEIACQRLSLTPEERKRYEALRAKLFAKLVRTEELEHGFSFVLKHEEILLHDLADWIPLENKCCPFLRFNIVIYQDEYVRLQLTGPKEVKGFLLHELNLFKE
jgi:hypothetical protein